MKRLNYLAIPLVMLLTACQSSGGIDVPATDSTTGAAEARTEDVLGDIDMNAAAETLGVSPEELKNALGTPLDVSSAAAELGVSETALREALDSSMPL